MSNNIHWPPEHDHSFPRGMSDRDRGMAIHWFYKGIVYGVKMVTDSVTHKEIEELFEKHLNKPNVQ